MPLETYADNLSDLSKLLHDLEPLKSNEPMDQPPMEVLCAIITSEAAHYLPDYTQYLPLVNSHMWHNGLMHCVSCLVSQITSPFPYPGHILALAKAFVHAIVAREMDVAKYIVERVRAERNNEGIEEVFEDLYGEKFQQGKWYGVDLEAMKAVLRAAHDEEPWLGIVSGNRRMKANKLPCLICLCGGWYVRGEDAQAWWASLLERGLSDLVR
jgi:hypothetical protein